MEVWRRGRLPAANARASIALDGRDARGPRGETTDLLIDWSEEVALVKASRSKLLGLRLSLSTSSPPTAGQVRPRALSRCGRSQRGKRGERGESPSGPPHWFWLCSSSS